MTLLISYLYNQDLLRDDPKLPYFLLCKSVSETEFEFDEINNEILRLRRRKKNHELVTLLMYLSERWLIGIFSMGPKQLHVIDLQSSKTYTKDKLKIYFNNAYS